MVQPPPPPPPPPPLPTPLELNQRHHPGAPDRSAFRAGSRNGTGGSCRSARRRCAVLACLLHLFAVCHAEGEQCGRPGRPVNGTVSTSGHVYFPGERVSYSCLEGFVLFGDEERVCQKNGTWSLEVPLCDFNLARGKRTLQSSTLWSYTPGLAVDGNPDTCSFTPRGPDTRWWQVHLGHKFNVLSVGVTISPGSFQHFTIYVIELLTDNKALYKTCTSFQGVFQTHKGVFECNDGLGHPGQFVYIRDDRQEEEYFGLCEVQVFAFRERIPCGPPEVPVDGEVEREGETRARYSCKRGFRLEGDALLTCNSKGKWQGQAPKCLEVKCPSPPNIRHGFVEIPDFQGVYKMGTLARYTCNPGYTLHEGNGSRTCDHTGAWSGTNPVCRSVTCGPPPEFPHARHTLLNESTSWSGIAVYTCKPGYKLHRDTGDTVTTCLDIGAWRFINITCVPDHDIPPPPPPPPPRMATARRGNGRALTFDSTLKEAPESHDSMHSLVVGLAVFAALLTAVLLGAGGILARRKFLEVKSHSSPTSSMNGLVSTSFTLARGRALPVGDDHGAPGGPKDGGQFSDQGITTTQFSPTHGRSPGVARGAPSYHYPGGLVPLPDGSPQVAQGTPSMWTRDGPMDQIPTSDRSRSSSGGSSDIGDIGVNVTVLGGEEDPDYAALSSRVEPPYERVRSRSEHSYETIRKLSRMGGGDSLQEPPYELGSETSRGDPGYETVDKDSVGYESVRESHVGGEGGLRLGPGVEIEIGEGVGGVGKDPGYETVREKDNEYETLKEKDHGYEIVRDGSDDSSPARHRHHSYETLRPKPPPRFVTPPPPSSPLPPPPPLPPEHDMLDKDEDVVAEVVPDILQHIRDSVPEGSIAPEILELYARVDKSKKTKSQGRLRPRPSSPPPPPVASPTPSISSISTDLSTATSFSEKPSSNPTPPWQRLPDHLPGQDVALRRLNRGSSHEDHDFAPPSRHGSIVSLETTSSVSGTLRPLPPLPTSS